MGAQASWLTLMVSSVMDAVSGSPWGAAGTVAGFAQAAPNAVLTQFAALELARSRNARLLDIGCGAARMRYRSHRSVGMFSGSICHCPCSRRQSGVRDSQARRAAAARRRRHEPATGERR